MSDNIPRVPTSIHYTSCPVCFSSGIHKIWLSKDHSVSGESFEIWQCSNCSLRFTQDVPDASTIGRYYESENYISHTDTRQGLINRLYHLVRRFTLSSKRRLVEGMTGINTGRLLDIGAGTGAFVHHMQSAGWAVTGIEQEREAVKNALDIYNLKLHDPGVFFDLPMRSFDCITMWHVLEHVHELHAYLDQIRELCKPAGRILIAVPNYTSYDAELYSGNWAAYDVPRHLYHFSPASINILFRDHGLKTESIQPMWFDSFYVSLLSEKYKSGSTNLFRGFWNGFRSNSKAFRNRRRASSVVYVVSVMQAQLPA